MIEEKKNLSYSLQHNTDVRHKEKSAFLSVLLGLLLVAHHCCVQGPVVGGKVEVAQGKAGCTAPVVVYLQPHSNRSSVTQAGSQLPPQQEAAQEPWRSREHFHGSPPPSLLSAFTCASHKTPPGQPLARPAPQATASSNIPGTIQAKSNSPTTATNLGCSDWRVSLWNEESGWGICTPEESELLHGTRRWIPISLAPVGFVWAGGAFTQLSPTTTWESRWRCRQNFSKFSHRSPPPPFFCLKYCTQIGSLNTFFDGERITRGNVQLILIQFVVV